MLRIPTSDWFVRPGQVGKWNEEAKRSIVKGDGALNDGTASLNNKSSSGDVEPIPRECTYLGFHFRVEADARANWPHTTPLKSVEKRLEIMRAVDRLAVRYNCSKVVLQGKPFATRSERSALGNRFLETDFWTQLRPSG